MVSGSSRPLQRSRAGATSASMKHVTIRLEDAEGSVLEERTVKGEFASINHCIATLAARPPCYTTPAELDALLLEGLNSEEREWTPELVEEIRRDAGLVR